MGIGLEICVDSAAGLAEAVRGGADRIELCAALALGGLTPSAGLMAAAAGCGVPVMAMIRPRAGDFVWSEAEVRMMEADIAAARAAGLAGVVLGALRDDGQLDGAALRRLVAMAAGMDLTLHRCIDLVPDPAAALETAVALGFRRVLTSGGEVTAEAGVARIGALVRQAAGRISVMPGAGISAENAAVFKALGIAEVHASCSLPRKADGRLAALGFAPVVDRQTVADRVRALRAALE